MRFKCPINMIRGTTITYHAAYDTLAGDDEKTYMISLDEANTLHNLFKDDGFEHLSLAIVITVSKKHHTSFYDPHIEGDKILCMIIGEFDPVVLKLTSGVEAL